MYLHKYKKDSDTFYRITSGAAKPSETITLKVSDWSGRVPGTSKIKSYLQIIEDTFREKPEEEPAEKEKKEKKATLAGLLRKCALMLEKE